MTGETKFSAAATTSKAAVRMAFPSPSGSVTVSETARAKLVIGVTRGMIAARTALTSGVIRARTSRNLLDSFWNRRRGTYQQRLRQEEVR